MLYSLVLSTLIALTFGAVRNFHPEKQDILQYNREKIWLWLDNNCFASQTEVLNFKNELLSKYPCLKYDHKKHKRIFKCGENNSMWSLWLNLNDEYDDFSCLDENKEISVQSECINKIVYEPYQHHDGMGFEVLSSVLTKTIDVQATSCVVQTSFGGISSTSMYSLDLMDGRIDNEYRYLSFGSASTSDNTRVQAIILDEGVEASHSEFVGLSFNTIYDFDLTTISTFDHGTHVTGTVLGKNVGGAKNTPIWNYPVCQSASGCAWGDIEAGYNGAIELMEANPNTRYVINYSVGGKKSPLTTPQYESWGAAIQSLGNMWITSAGNSAANACNYSPAYSSYAVTVGAFNNQLTPSTWFTNYGSCVDVWAPGESVVSSFPGNAYATASGTSMASPGIAGLAINLLKQNPTWTPANVRNYFKTSGNYNVLTGTTSSFAPNNYAPFWKTSC